MTYKQLQDEVIALRFDETRRASVKSWLSLSYISIWNKANWHWRHVNGANLSVVGGNNAPVMPPEFAKSEGLYDNFGARLTFLEPDNWRDIWFNTPAPISTPSQTYTVVNRQIYLGPTPGGSATYTLAYERRLAHVDAVSGVIGGTMQSDTDQPLSPAEYDYILIFDACIRGGALLGDLDVGEIQTQRDDLLQAMIEECVGSEKGEILEQWGPPSYAGRGFF